MEKCGISTVFLGFYAEIADFCRFSQFGAAENRIWSGFGAFRAGLPIFAAPWYLRQESENLSLRGNYRSANSSGFFFGASAAAIGLFSAFTMGEATLK